MMMLRKSLNELREEMRGIARGERKASPLPATPRGPLAPRKTKRRQRYAADIGN
jgi:hypothetical protein